MTNKPAPKKTTRDGSANSGEATDKSKNSKKPVFKMDSRRETIESVVVAFILAFLFRTFEAEAFVIPTGSMAPTLRGRHKEVECEKCKFRFSIGASDEVEQPGFLLPQRLIGDVVCPNCRHTTSGDIVQKLPVYKGDRILVNKFPYEFGDPKRWDVLVFKYPEEPGTNYIKRLVGLPGDKLNIIQGNVYLEDKNNVLTVLRKDNANKQLQLQLLVHNNDYPAPELLKQGWPKRWAAVKKSQSPGHVAGWSETDESWTANTDTNSFTTSQTDQYQWLRYRHYVASEEEWEAVLQGQKPENPRPQLITDYCSYNAYRGGTMGKVIDYGQYWVGELTLNCEVNIEEVGDEAELILELHQGPRTYRCKIDVASGTATLLRNVSDNVEEDEWITLASAETRVSKAGKYHLSFANVDQRLCLWVNDKLIDFGTDDEGREKSRYKRHGARGYNYPIETDLTPVGIAAKGLSISVSHLLIQRDIYYRGERVRNDDDGTGNQSYEYKEPYSRKGRVGIPVTLNGLLHDPGRWGEEYQQNHSPAVFARLDADEFFVMGDNSPRSKDSRLWSNMRGAKHRHAVPRKNLVGKAFYIYWPHGVPFLNNGNGYPVSHHRTIDGQKTDYPSFRFPFYPNFKRMRRIR